VALLAGAAGVFLFYVQNQFEDAYWESGESWGYADAALRGSSYLRLNKVLQFFTANIGLHPNSFRYRLRRLGEVAAIDLADPETRVLLGLLLRLD